MSQCVRRTKRQGLTMKQDQPLQRLLNDTAAATYVGVKPGTLRNLRSSDRRRIERGEEPRGPRWIVVRGRAFYERTDLDGWIDGNAVPYAKTSARPWLEDYARRRADGSGELE